jgi:hypothetical protein
LRIITPQRLLWRGLSSGILHPVVRWTFAVCWHSPDYKAYIIEKGTFGRPDTTCDNKVSSWNQTTARHKHKKNIEIGCLTSV